MSDPLAWVDKQYPLPVVELDIPGETVEDMLVEGCDEEVGAFTDEVPAPQDGSAIQDPKEDPLERASSTGFKGL